MSDSDEDSDSAGGGGDASAIIVVDPDPTSRNLAEDLEDDFDRQVIGMDSIDFDTESAEEVIDAGVYIFCWDLGFRSGADLLEEVRKDERLCHKTVLIATEAPTSSLVRTAMLLGADGVCMKPLNGDEIGAIFERLEAARSQKAA